MAARTPTGGSGGSTYVPGYGYVDPRDPGTSGSVKKGPKPKRTGQEPAGTSPPFNPGEMPRPNPEDSLLVRNRPIFDIDFGADLVSPEQRQDMIDEQDQRVSLEAQTAAALGQNSFGTEAMAQRVADINDGYVVEYEPGKFKVVYGVYALQAEAIDRREAQTTPSNYQNLPEDRMAGTPSNYMGLPSEGSVMDPESDGGRYGSTFSTDPTAYAPKYSIRQSMFSQQPPTAVMTYEELKTAREKQDRDGFLVYMGTVTTAGSTGAVDADNLQDGRIVADYNMLEPEEKMRVLDLIDRYYKGMKWQPSWIKNRWKDAVYSASQKMLLTGERVSPFDVYDEMLAMEAAWNAERDASSGASYYGGGGYGGGYGGGGGSATIQLTSRTDALVILNQAMQQFLGRKANADELEKFVKMLNAREMDNPVRQEYDGNTAIQSGGFNPQTFAEEFATSQEGSAEYQAATSYLNSFLSILDGDTGVL